MGTTGTFFYFKLNLSLSKAFFNGQKDKVRLFLIFYGV